MLPHHGNEFYGHGGSIDGFPFPIQRHKVKEELRIYIEMNNKSNNSAKGSNNIRTAYTDASRLQI